MNAVTLDALPLPLHAAGVGDLAGRWWVAQTRPQYEKMLARDLNRLRVDYFLPLMRISRKKARGDRYEAVVPLFPGYVFVNGDDETRYQAARSPFTARIIDVLAQQQMSHELENLERAIAVQPHLQSYPGMVVGTPCRIRQGHKLEGTEGVLQRRDDQRHKFVIRVTMLGQHVPVEIDPEFIEAI